MSMSMPGVHSNLPSPIFVVGYMHSGTTLLRKIIGRHPSVFSIRAETMYFDQLKAILPHRFPNLRNDSVFEDYVRFLIWMTTFDRPPITAVEAQFEPNEFRVDEELTQQIIVSSKHKREYIEVFSCVYGMIAEAAGKQFWLEKTPSHIFHVDVIFKGVPGVRFVEIVRDPRDILSSKKIRKQTNWAERYGETAVTKVQKGLRYDPLRTSLGWRAAIQAGTDAAERYPDRFYRLRYEDLVSDPEGATRGLCQYLSLDYVPSMLDVGWSNSTSQDAGDKPTGIDRRAVGKWQRTLPPDVVSLCQMVNRDKMKLLGYQQVNTSIGSRAKGILWIVRSGLDFVARMFELWRQRGLVVISSRLRNYWLRVGNFSKR